MSFCFFSPTLPGQTETLPAVALPRQLSSLCNLHFAIFNLQFVFLLAGGRRPEHTASWYDLSGFAGTIS
jgi:hypothetical protein